MGSSFGAVVVKMTIAVWEVEGSVPVGGTAFLGHVRIRIVIWRCSHILIFVQNFEAIDHK
jgi:hypothetical protein